MYTMSHKARGPIKYNGGWEIEESRFVHTMKFLVNLGVYGKVKS